MTIFYPDISSFQAGINLKGALAVACKVTQGTGYVNPDYNRARTNAASNGAFFFAYHFLTQGNAAGQAGWCHSRTGNTPVMVDFEPSGGSNPTLADCVAFIDTFRRIGGIVNLVYLPHFYWQQLGSPSLVQLEQRGISLVSADYATYGDVGAGWTPYGGMIPTIWQYTDRVPFNGYSVDFNAFKGSGNHDIAHTLAEFKSIVTTGKMPSKPTPKPQADKVGNPVNGLKVDARWTEADASWKASLGATSYRVKLWGHFPRRKLQQIDTSETNVTFMHLKKGARYTVTVLAEPSSARFKLAGRASLRFDTKR